MRNRQRMGKPGSRLPRQARGNPRLKEQIHDPYRASKKLRGPCRCKQCGATYLKGRWQWRALTPPAPAATVCPACRRLNDRYPAGELIVRGAFAAKHSAEVERLIVHVAEAESREHPLHRIIATRRRGSTLTVTTTDVHLPHRIGHALEDAWAGTLSTHYDEAGYFARAAWERDE